MGQMQRRKRVAREWSGKVRLSVLRRPRTWATAEEFEADAPKPLGGREYAEILANAGMFVWYDAAEEVIKARRAYDALPLA